MEFKISDLFRISDFGFRIFAFHVLRFKFYVSRFLSYNKNIKKPLIFYIVNKKKKKLIKGKLNVHVRGFGFIKNEEKDIDDVFVFNTNMNSAMHNDIVVGEIIKSENGKTEAKIIEIIERSNKKIIGTLKMSESFGFVVPDDPRVGVDVYIPKNEFNKAKDRHKVVVEITKWPSVIKKNPSGRIIEDLGHRSSVGVDILSIVRKYNLSEKFPKNVIQETDKIDEQISQKEISKRRDLRDQPIITIDDISAQDLDDAISLKILDNGNYLLGVHIADVSHYVIEKSALDKEAFERATSIYFPDRVIPMLPEKISNNLCSLNPKEDKLTLSVNIEINNHGNVVFSEFYNSIIKTKERMTYDDISDILENDDIKLRKKYAPFLEIFLLMEKLQKILNKKRISEGAIDFDFPEIKIILNESGKPIKIEKKERRIANKIIEEFMILCNEAVAKFFNKNKIPFIYRNHKTPNVEKIKTLSNFVKKYGHELEISKQISPLKVQQLLKNTQGQIEEKAVNLLVFQAMEKAIYGSKNIGHFGLSLKNYSHFTSPIRRYPDLQIHRIVKLFISDNLNEEKKRELKIVTDIVARNSLEQELVAIDAQREAENLKKTQYMSYYLGEEFEGVISNVVSFGFFVELDNGIYGLVRIGSLDDDYYEFDESNLLLKGKKTKKIYKINDKIKVKIEKADLEQKKIDFVLV